jgi:hypothetical protein
MSLLITVAIGKFWIFSGTAVYAGLIVAGMGKNIIQTVLVTVHTVSPPAFLYSFRYGDPSDLSGNLVPSNPN